MMKTPNILLFIGLTILLVLSSIFLLLYYLNGIDTVWDEGFYMLWLNEKNTNLQYSQSYYIINLFLSSFKNKLIEFRIITLLLKYFFVVIFIIVFNKILKKLNINLTLVHFLVIFLSFLPSFLINSKVFCYREIQQFSCLFSWLLCIHINLENKNRFIQYFVLSLSLIFPIINIPPSGIINFVACVFFILLIHRPKIKEIFKFTLIFISAFLLLNFTLSNFIFNIKSIILNGLVISKGDKTHSLISLFQMFVVFFKSFLIKYYLVISVLIIIYFLKNKILQNVVVCTVIIFSIYNFSFCLDLLILPLILIVLRLIPVKNFEKRSFLYVFLFITPFTAVIGSAIPITLNLYYYIPIWIVLLIILLDRKKLFYSKLFLFHIILFFSFSIFKLNNEFGKYLGNQFNSKHHLSFKSKIDNVKITLKQKKYFNRVNNLLIRSKFKKNKDYFFTLNYDFMTVYLFDGKLCTKPYHQIGVFLEDNKYNKPEIVPKYIILDQSAIKIISRKNNWNFPFSYKKHFVGCPDIGNVNRYLYIKSI